VKKLCFAAYLVFLISGCRSQGKNEKDQTYRLIGGCEGCEAIFEFGDKELFPVDTLPDFDEEGPKLKVTGTIYLMDGKTPAAGVILYVYHTDQTGVYPTHGDETGWGRRHGYIRGWIRTGNDGRYTFYTLKPGTYPSRSAAAHIHPIILEPDGKYYWLGSYLFDDDPLLTEAEKYPKSPRGGSSGIMTLHKQDGILVGERDIILGENISNYN